MDEESPVAKEVGGASVPLRDHDILGLLRSAPTFWSGASAEVAPINRLDPREQVAGAVESTNALSSWPWIQ